MSYLKIKGINAKETDITYSDFVIRKKHMFLRNIFSDKVLEKSQKIGTLKDYYDSFSLFLIICDAIELVINKVLQLDEVNNEYLTTFLDEKCNDILDFNDLKEEISKMEIEKKILVKRQFYKFMLSFILD